jgi:hypothetical protein
MNKRLATVLMGTALSVMAAAAPFMASAHTSSTASTTDCKFSWGHLIAPGWLRKNGQSTTTVASGCSLPFGIGMKLHDRDDGHGTTTATSTRPFMLRIFDVKAIASSTSAVIHWRTNAAADATVYYSTTTPVTIGATSTASVGTTARAYDHSVTLNGLATSTGYSYILKSTDSQGRSTVSPEFRLTTGM